MREHQNIQYSADTRHNESLEHYDVISKKTSNVHKPDPLETESDEIVCY
jgi:hypothetical protein